MNHIVAPSILAADFGNLQRDVEMINQSEADWIHVDIMDGVFVPNISFGFPVFEAIKKHSKKPLDTHLMIQHPENYVDGFIKAGSSNITVHYEATVHLHRLVHHIKDQGITAGVALNPHTPISFLEDIIQDVDLVLIMSVNPGFGGQKFIEHTYAKIQELKNLILRKKSKALIEIDGGVNQENAPKLLASGADVLVAGNFVFSSDHPAATIKDLKKLDVARTFQV
ncbi:MAG TPA: ribulose-phosphate 3-epimerase [Cytophagales bacterium]|nr:ribulose-phosphate 3-epimerase [Cytophagales bacterium]